MLLQQPLTTTHHRTTQLAPDGVSTQLTTKDYLPDCWKSLVTHRMVLGHSQALEHDSSSTTEVVSQVWQVSEGGSFHDAGALFLLFLS